MGDSQSKTADKKSEDNVSTSARAVRTATTETERNRPTANEQRIRFEYGEESGFWLMLQIDNPSAFSAEILNYRISQDLGLPSSMIVGVMYTDRDLGLSALCTIYCKDFNTVDFVWECLQISGVHKVLRMPKPSVQGKTVCLISFII